MMKRAYVLELSEDAIPFHECDDLDESVVRCLTKACDENDYDARGWLSTNVINIDLAA